MNQNIEVMKEIRISVHSNGAYSRVETQNYRPLRPRGQTVTVHDPGNAKIKVNDRTILPDHSYLPGLTLVVVDLADREVSAAEHFDTQDSSEDARRLSVFLSNVGHEAILIVAAKGDASVYLDDVIRAQFREFGSERIKDFTRSRSWSFIGRRGASAGQACEMLCPPEQGAFAGYYIPAPIPETLKYDIIAISGDDTPMIAVNGVSLLNKKNCGNGINVVVVDPDTVDVLSAKKFDIVSDPDAAFLFAEHLDSVPYGGIAIIITVGSLGGNIPLLVSNALISIGGIRGKEIPADGRYCLIGKKGARSAPYEMFMYRGPVAIGCSQYRSSARNLAPFTAVDLVSNGRGQCSFGKIAVQGAPWTQELDFTGVQVVAVDKLGRLASAEVFDRINTDEDASEFIAFLKEIPDGSIVSLVTSGEDALGRVWSDQKNKEALCKEFGIEKAPCLKGDVSWTVSGARGAAPLAQLAPAKGIDARSRVWAARPVTNGGQVYSICATSSGDDGKPRISVRCETEIVEDLVASEKEGFLLAILEERSGKCLEQRFFKPSELKSVPDVLKTVPEGRFVVVAASGILDFSEELISECANLGSAQAVKIRAKSVISNDQLRRYYGFSNSQISTLRTSGFPCGWCLIGVKGAPVGAMPECLNIRGAATCAITMPLTLKSKLLRGLLPLFLVGVGILAVAAVAVGAYLLFDNFAPGRAFRRRKKHQDDVTPKEEPKRLQIDESLGSQRYCVYVLGCLGCIPEFFRRRRRNVNEIRVGAIFIALDYLGSPQAVPGSIAATVQLATSFVGFLPMYIRLRHTLGINDQVHLSVDFLCDDVTQMPFGPQGPNIDFRVSPANAESLVAALARIRGDSSIKLAFIQFAGHGCRQSEESGAVLTGVNLLQNLFEHRVASIPPSCKNITLFFDSCFSGGMIKAPRAVGFAACPETLTGMRLAPPVGNGPLAGTTQFLANDFGAILTEIDTNAGVFARVKVQMEDLVRAHIQQLTQLIAQSDAVLAEINASINANPPPPPNILATLLQKRATAQLARDGFNDIRQSRQAFLLHHMPVFRAPAIEQLLPFLSWLG